MRFHRLYKSNHNPIRMFFFHIQALYNICNLIFSWFALANLWLTFSIIITMLPTIETPVYLFGTPAITFWVNSALQWIYLAFLAMQFILALGSRPKGEKGLYITTFVVYGLMSIYLMVCAVWLMIVSFKGVLQNAAKEGYEGAWGQFRYLFSQNNSAVLLAAIASTIGIYLLASVIYGDPWHMFSSFPQYMVMAPSFTNVLNVYAFCNLHDVSWGTKGSDKPDALPSVQAHKDEDGKVVVDDVVPDEKELNKSFSETMTRALERLPKTKEKEEVSPDDSNRSFRTNLVAFWLLSNAVLIMVFGVDTAQDNTKKFVDDCIKSATDSNSDLNSTCVLDALTRDDKFMSDRRMGYFAFILWGTFGLTAFRFIGFLYFWFGRQISRIGRKN